MIKLELDEATNALTPAVLEHELASYTTVYGLQEIMKSFEPKCKYEAMIC